MGVAVQLDSTPEKEKIQNKKIFSYGNLTRVDSRLKVSLKGLPNKLRGGAWPSPARTVRRAVKSVNERDPHPTLLLLSSESMHS